MCTSRDITDTSEGAASHDPNSRVHEQENLGWIHVEEMEEEERPGYDRLEEGEEEEEEDLLLGVNGGGDSDNDDDDDSDMRVVHDGEVLVGSDPLSISKEQNPNRLTATEELLVMKSRKRVKRLCSSSSSSAASPLSSAASSKSSPSNSVLFLTRSDSFVRLKSVVPKVCDKSHVSNLDVVLEAIRYIKLLSGGLKEGEE